MIEVGLSRVELVGRHGVSEEERARPQRFVFDVSVVLDRDDAAESDRLEDTVDYRQLLASVREVCEEREYHLLERLAGAVVEELRRRFSPRAVTVTVNKPDVWLETEAQPRVTVEWP